MVKGKAEINTLPIDEVAVQERSVTIRVLTVGTKQVTQTMYKQLIRDDLCFDRYGHLLDDIELWGWVNACSFDHMCDALPTYWAGYRKKEEHFHVVYEYSGMLKRALVSISLSQFANWDSCNRARAAIHDAGQLFIAVSGVWK